MKRKSTLLCGILLNAIAGSALAGGGELYVDRREVNDYNGWIYAPIISRFSYGDVKYKVTVPVVHFTSAASAGFYSDEALASRSSALTYAELGDIAVKASRKLWRSTRSGAHLDVGGKLELATGNANKDIGSGRTEGTFMLDLAQRVSAVELLTGVSYTARHSFTDDATQSGFAGYVGVALNLAPRTVFDVTYEHSQASEPGDPAQRGLSFAFNHADNRALRVRSYAAIEREGADQDYELGFTLTKEW